MYPSNFIKGVFNPIPNLIGLGPDWSYPKFLINNATGYISFLETRDADPG